MKDTHTKRKQFLRALINYANESGNLNPHFYKQEMMAILGISEGEFNMTQHNLGQKYCYYVGPHEGKDRYAINVSECLTLQEQYDQETINTRRHKQIVRLAVLVAVLGAILGVTLNYWITE
ncbi:hypothetical protein [Desulfosudis oleivorans]|uniref:hypothetical protein n=1 Tax=Desulfosudis oleivorans TaxID=181663 RepID=UPI00059C7973|nr:hypothetical protein [Desulfosudis oleivorans]